MRKCNRHIEELLILKHKLNVLKLGRNNLISEFKNPNSSNIIEPAWDFHDSPTALSISIIRLRLIWLLNHGEIFKIYIKETSFESNPEYLIKEIYSTIISLLKVFLSHLPSDPYTTYGQYDSYLKNFIHGHDAILNVELSTKENIAAMKIYKKKCSVQLKRIADKFR